MSEKEGTYYQKGGVEKRLQNLDNVVKAIIVVLLFMVAGLIIDVVSGYKASSQNLINQINEQSTEIEKLSDKTNLMLQLFLEDTRRDGKMSSTIQN